MIENKFQLQWSIPFQKFDSKMNEKENFCSYVFLIDEGLEENSS